MVAVLRGRTCFALDTESDSFFAYYPKVCLIQITTFADENAPDPDSPNSAHSTRQPDPDRVIDYLVDPLRLPTLAPLSELIAAGTQEVIMHAADNDITMLRRGFDFRFPRIFDTQLAARILGQQHVGLGAMLEEYFGVVSDKRMQRTDWSARPLTQPQIAYAQMDTHYLIALRERMNAELEDAGRTEEAADAFESLVQQSVFEKTPPVRSVWQMKAAHRGNHLDMAVLDALWQWREGEAQEQNRPPFKIMSDELLVDLAQRQPATGADLDAIGALSGPQRSRYGKALVQVIREGKARPAPQRPQTPPRPELTLTHAEQKRFDRLRNWRTQTANGRGVAPEIVFNNETLFDVAVSNPADLEALAAIPGISPWKAQAYGEALLEQVRAVEPDTPDHRPA